MQHVTRVLLLHVHPWREKHALREIQSLIKISTLFDKLQQNYKRQLTVRGGNS